MVSSGPGDINLEEDDKIYEKSNKFKSFHDQASLPISRKALLAGFLSTWLKMCVILSLPRDGISPMALFPAVQ